jgi:hypothetical protein
VDPLDAGQSPVGKPRKARCSNVAPSPSSRRAARCGRDGRFRARGLHNFVGCGGTEVVPFSGLLRACCAGDSRTVPIPPCRVWGARKTSCLPPRIARPVVFEGGRDVRAQGQGK